MAGADMLLVYAGLTGVVTLVIDAAAVASDVRAFAAGVALTVSGVDAAVAGMSTFGAGRFTVVANVLQLSLAWLGFWRVLLATFV